MVQTPHHFYSPDPFQRNLAAGTRVPAEGNMFYGLVQDGNDFWNAAFFCGSCAVHPAPRAGSRSAASRSRPSPRTRIRC